MPAWSVELIEAAEAELFELPDDMQAKFLHIAEMLEELGPQRVGLPHVRPLEDKLWEMRMTGRDGIARAVYFAMTGRRLLVVRIFVKKTEKTPRREIEIARLRMREAVDAEKAQ